MSTMPGAAMGGAHQKTRQSAWRRTIRIGEGRLDVGDEMIYALVAGDVRTNVVPAWTAPVRTIRTEVITKREILA